MTFEAYIKSAIDKSVLKARIKKAARQEKEQPISTLANAVLNALAAEGSDSIQDEMDCEVFDVRGIRVPVYGQSLGQALYHLMPQDREIIMPILRFFLRSLLSNFGTRPKISRYSFPVGRSTPQ